MTASDLRFRNLRHSKMEKVSYPTDTPLDLDLDNLMKRYGIQNPISVYDATVVNLYPQTHINQSKTGPAIRQKKKFNIPDCELDDENDPYADFRFLLLMGRIFGLIPFSGIMSRSSRNVSFRRLSLPSVISHIIFLVVIINAGLAFFWTINQTRSKAFEVIQSFRIVLHNFWAVFLFTSFLFRSKEFLKIFEVWRSTHIVYSRKDTKLLRDIILISVVLMSSIILENAVLHLKYFRELDEATGNTRVYNHSSNFSSFESFYWRSNLHWATAIGYNWFVAAIAFLQHKWVLYAWNYMDCFLAIMGRAVYFPFKTLCETAEKELMKTKGAFVQVDATAHRQAWTQIVYDHKSLCKILEAVEKFFSPIVFGSFALNLYYLCLQLVDCLTLDVMRQGIANSVYFPWSVLHLIARCFSVAIYCAKINTYAHKIRSVLHECPTEYYEPEISRLDKRLTFGPDIGMTGLECFVVTKPFILQIIGVLFTFEIIVLQLYPKVLTYYYFT